MNFSNHKRRYPFVAFSTSRWGFDPSKRVGCESDPIRRIFSPPLRFCYRPRSPEAGFHLGHKSHGQNHRMELAIHAGPGCIINYYCYNILWAIIYGLWTICTPLLTPGYHLLHCVNTSIGTKLAQILTPWSPAQWELYFKWNIFITFELITLDKFRKQFLKDKIMTKIFTLSQAFILSKM